MNLFNRGTELLELRPDNRPLGVRLSEVQQAIHVQKLEMVDARHRLLDPASTAGEYDDAVFDLDFAYGTLDVLKDTCFALQHKLGQNRKGQPLPDHIAVANEQ